MPIHHPTRPCAIAVALTFALFAASTASAQTTPTAKKPAPAKPARKAATPPKPVQPAPPPAAGAEQIDAAERVYYGVYDCEFKQSIDIAASPKYPSYVDVKHGKAAYLMKPVLSSTGAIRLEDVRGETLMVQISSKSMLLNVKTAQRIVDECVTPKQRELIEAALVAKAQAAAASAAPASAATPASAAASAVADAAAPASAPTIAPPASAAMTTIAPPETK